MTEMLRADNLTKRYNGVLALDSASLTLAKGEFTAILGPSGSGKTTLFRCLTRLVEPDSGGIYVGGEAFHGLRGRSLRKARRSLGVVFQQFNLIKRRTALENALTGRLDDASCWSVAVGRFSKRDREHAEAALEVVGLIEYRHQRADTLSGGQQQRVAIARALAQESAVLLADEPVASLDPETAQQILSLLRDLAETRGLAVLCTLHQPDLAERFATRVLEMRRGRLSDGGHSHPPHKTSPHDIVRCSPAL